MRRVRGQQISTQLSHPKTTKSDTTSARELVITDLMGLISPTALKAFRYAAKTMDHFTRWKDGILIKHKNNATDAFKVFVQEVAISMGL